MTATVRLRPATDADWPLLRSWCRRPDIQAWWGPEAAMQAEINMALGSSLAKPRIIVADGEPIGYAQAVDAVLWGDAMPAGLPPGTWDLDIFIASERHRGQGHGVAALVGLRDEVFATTLAGAISVVVSVRNERAVRAYEKAGFRWLKVCDDPDIGPAWIMLAERPQA